MEANKIIEELLETNNWMSKSIAIIGIRYNISNERKEIVKKEIKCDKNKMDLTWLFHLYYTDNFCFDFKISNDRNLTKTPWGICELFSK